MRKRTVEIQGQKWEVEAIPRMEETKAGRASFIGETPYDLHCRRLDGRDERIVTVPPEVGRRFDADDATRVALGLPRSEPELSDQELVGILERTILRRRVQEPKGA